MEVVETHAPSSFDHTTSKPAFPFSPPAAIPAGDHFNRPDIGGGAMGIALSSDSGAPVADADAQNDVVKDVAVQDSEIDAAMTVQKAYRGYRTRRMLADSAVVAEELWWQALDYARLNHSTVSFFNFKPESAASRWNRIRLNAAKVGKGLSNDAKAQKLAFQHWIEAIDPRHRYGHSLHFYYEEWCKTDAGQPFFYWLDLGDGREVDLKECPRSKLRQQCIKYLGPQEREHYEYVIIDGKFLHKPTGEILDTPKGEKWIFVMSTTKKLYAGEKKKGVFHHSSFLAGGATLAAGRLVVVDGTLKSISAYSGHYRPTDEILDSFLQFLKDKGVNLDTVEVGRGKEGFEEYDEGNSMKDVPTSQITKNPDSAQAKPNEKRKGASLDPIEVPTYTRTLSGGLQTPKPDVPATAILQRLNSKKAASSYQLGHQLSRKWSTGAGPRIGCVADYPVELRLQALELTHLSPRPSAPSHPSPRPGSSSSPIKLPSQHTNNEVKVL